MRYSISIDKFKISKHILTLSAIGQIDDARITNNFWSKPKVIVFFNNGQEDRRMPLFITDIKYEKGKCYFSCTYDFDLKCLFWKTRNKHLPFSISFNLLFIDNYIENIDVSLDYKIEKFKTFFYTYKLDKNSFKIIPKKRPIFNLFQGLLNFIITTIKKLLLLRRYIGGMIFDSLFYINHLSKVKTNQIAFISMRRDDLSGNMAFVYDKLKDDNTLKIEFLLSSKSYSIHDIKRLFKLAKVCATSKVIILDEYSPILYRLHFRKQTKIIQLWHACGAFKTFGFTNPTNRQQTRNHRCYDYVTVSSSLCKKTHSEGFGISTKNVVATGIPRTDVFFDESYKTQVRKKFYDKYPHFKNKKIILFAPTFRGMDKPIAYYPTKMFDLKKICSKLPEDYVFIIKHHPFVKDIQPIPSEYKNRIIDLSNNIELNDLLFVTDLIITDYSSLIFEASLLNIPMLFYVFDIDEYIKERTFYFDFPHYIPGKIVKTQDELIEAINKKDFCKDKIAPFCDMFFDYKDGHSTDRVVELIKPELP